MTVNEFRRFVFDKDAPQVRILLQNLQSCNKKLYEDVLLDIPKLNNHSYTEIVEFHPGLRRIACKDLPVFFDLGEDAEIFQRHVSTLRVSRNSSLEYFLVFMALEDIVSRAIEIVPLLVMDERNNVITRIDFLE